MNSAAQRAFASMCRKEGQFTLLLDDQFDIIWHCGMVETMLGWSDLRGRNCTEFVHADDLEMVLDVMFKVNEGGEFYDHFDPSQTPESADIRVIDHQGVWRTYETVSYDHLDQPDVRGVLCTLRIVNDRSDVGRAIELLGSGADVEVVLPVVARLADHSVAGTARTAFGWLQGDRLRTAVAEDESPLTRQLAEAVGLVWSLALTEPLIISDLDDSRLGDAGPAARAAGFRVAFLVPIEAPSGGGIIGSMVAWGNSTVEFIVSAQAPLHVALRLAALAIADSRTKRDLRWAAAHDPLTGLVNRAEFARTLESLSANDDVVLLYIDLDDFKPINDRYGHAVGDTVLVEVGRRIRAVIGNNDVVGRLGGDEFAVVCAGTDDPIHGRDVANRIVEAVGQPIKGLGMVVRVGASVGVAVGAQPLIPSQLMQRADDALYLAKASGKNTVRLAS